jgi:ribonuclease HI
MPYVAHVDGGARGNPGPSAAGVHLTDESGTVILAAGLFLGHKTNNEAEYTGLLQGLELLAAAGARHVIIRSDSELLVRQMQGAYRVKAPNLKPLFDRAGSRAARFDKCEFQHVPRERNKDADRLANLAMDAVADVVEVDTLGLFAKVARPSVTATPAPLFPSQPGPAASRSLQPGSASSQRGAPAPTPVSQTPSRGDISLRVVKPPKPGICPAHMRAGAVFVFTDVVPAGLCVDACATAIDAVAALRSVLQDGGGPLEPMTVTCQRPDCGAVFQLQAGR